MHLVCCYGILEWQCRILIIQNSVKETCQALSCGSVLDYDVATPGVSNSNYLGAAGDGVWVRLALIKYFTKIAISNSINNTSGL